MSLPKQLRRISDGEIFSLNEDNTYSMDNSVMKDPYHYSYELLMEVHRGLFEIVTPDVSF